MAIEVNLVVNEQQVDLNNNSNQQNGDKKSNKNVNPIENSASDDLILKLKRIILEQEMNEVKQHEKLIDSENKSTNLVNDQSNKSSNIEKKSVCESSKSPVPEKVTYQANQVNHTSNHQVNGQSTKDQTNCKLKDDQQNENDDKKNQINCQSEKNNDLPNEINDKCLKDEPLIKETIKKDNEKDKVNQMNLTKIQNPDVKILVKSSIIKECSLKHNDKSKLKKTEETKYEPTDRQESCKTESKTDKPLKPDEIKIIHSKAVSNNKVMNKIDLNDNVQQSTIQNGHQQVQPNTDTVDRQTKSIDTVKINSGLPVKQEVPQYELIIRASDIDGKRKGADLFCQEYFMDLYLLAELKYIHLKILTIDIKKPSPNYRSKFGCTKPPILLFKANGEQMAILENEKIERFIMKQIPGGDLLFIKDPKSAKLIENLYCKFKLALSRNEPQTKQSLLNHLEAIDKHLGQRESKFLTGNHLCCFDFELISKLQHIRVAGSYFIDDFEIPKKLNFLWKYMDTMYHLNAFKEASPDDQTIIGHYLNSNSVLKNRTSPAKAKNQKHLELQKPFITVSTP